PILETLRVSRNSIWSPPTWSSALSWMEPTGTSSGRDCGPPRLQNQGIARHGRTEHAGPVRASGELCGHAGLLCGWEVPAASSTSWPLRRLAGGLSLPIFYAFGARIDGRVCFGPGAGAWGWSPASPPIVAMTLGANGAEAESARNVNAPNFTSAT